jgi:predicted metal-dependent hydrolase
MAARAARAGHPDGQAPGPRATDSSAPSSGTPVEVRRSSRRQRTVTAYRDGGTVVVCIPAGFSAAQERAWVRRMVARLDAQKERRRPSDEALARRATELSERYLSGRPRPSSVRWVANQNTRWGSTTTADGTIRLSDRLQGMPSWVVDYVLVHELAHLLEHGHGDAFWALVSTYPRSERARGYLEGFAAAGDLPSGEVDDSADPATAFGGR